jgi:hypothetical protein
MSGHLRLRIVDTPAVDKRTNTFSIAFVPDPPPSRRRGEHLFLSGSLTLLVGRGGAQATQSVVEEIGNAIARIIEARP